MYPHWQAVLYPQGLVQKSWLAYYSQHFPTVEINRSFYRLPARSVFEAWHRQTPQGFVFAVKASRYITHMKKLREPHAALERFFQAVGGLGDKAGPVLFQFPPFWRADLDRLAEFLCYLPPTYRYAFEFRHSTWLDDPVLDLLRKHEAALAIPDFPGMPCRPELTANFTYIRLHGGKNGPGYTQGELRDWSERIAHWSESAQVFVYFNNDFAGWAPRNAVTLWLQLKDMGLAEQLALLKPFEGQS